MTQFRKWIAASVNEDDGSRHECDPSIRLLFCLSLTHPAIPSLFFLILILADTREEEEREK